MTALIPDADMFDGNYGRYLSYQDNSGVVSTRVLACEDTYGDVHGDTVAISGDWRLTAILQILAWESSVDPVFSAYGLDRHKLWQVVRDNKRYTGITNEYYHDEYGWVVVVFKPLYQA